jgi:hypothetical protein
MNPEYPFQPGQQPSNVPQQPVQGQFTVPGTPPIPAAPQPGYAPVPPVHTPPITRRSRDPKMKWMSMTFVFIFTTLVSSGIAVWAYVNYVDQKNNVDSKVSVAVAAAVKEQADKDAANFLEKEKQPNRQFVGPDDYGRLSFDYPKTWSVYVAKDASEGGSYEAYFNPGAVPEINAKQQYALHVTIQDQDYDKVVDGYKRLVSSGDLKSSAVSLDGQNGTRLDGSFTKDIRGYAVIVKIRDKTVTVRSDAETFKGDFEALIKTITFNK